MENYLIKNKKSLSSVITTILLILLAITAIVIIGGFVVPFIENYLEKGKCIETLEQLTINAEQGYACYYNNEEVGEYEDKKIVNITISRKDIDIEEFIIKIGGEGDSNNFNIKSGPVEESKGIRMLDGSLDIEIPGKGGDKTYSLQTTLSSAKYAEIYPILKNGVMCEKTDYSDLVKCED